MVTIYQLRDPITQKVRYVGKAVDVLKRFRTHLRDAKQGNTSNHRTAWLRSLYLKNKQPILEILEECDPENWQEREKHWIATLKMDLTNVCEGGQSGPLARGKDSFHFGRTRSDETKLLISERAKERWRSGSYDVLKNPSEKIRTDRRNRMLSYNETRVITEETKRKISAAQAAPIQLIDSNGNVCFEFENARLAAEFLGCKRSNINNARRQNRLVQGKYYVRSMG